MNDILLTKLKKLLNLAESSNGAEAESALAKATELATNAGIDLAVVATMDVNTKEEKLEMVEDTIRFGSRLPTLQKYASWLLNKHFGVTVIYSGSRYFGKEIAILGDKKDVEFAKYVNSFIQEDMQRRWEYYKRTNNLSVRLKQTFMYNCYRGFDMALAAAKQATKETRFAAMPVEVRETVESKYALVVRTKADTVKAFVEKTYPRLGHVTRSHTNCYASSSVAQDGFAIGQTMTVSRPLPC